MIKKNRMNDILFLLKQRKTMKMSELATYFSISPITLRQDIQYLSKLGLIRRSYGEVSFLGASYITGSLAIAGRQNSLIQNKHRIAEQTAAYIKSNSTIYLDDSTTISCLVPYITQIENLTIITNSLCILHSLSEANIQIICIGGILSPKHQAFVGADGIEQLSRHKIDTAIIGASGINQNYGTCELAPAISEIKKKACERSRDVYLLVDHTKFLNNTGIPCIPWKKISLLSTDTILTKKMIAKQKEFGFDILN